MFLITEACYPKAFETTMKKIRDFGLSVSPRGMPTRELSPCTVVIPDTARKFLVIPGRGLNYAFGLRELVAIMSGENDVDALAFYNPRMRQFSDGGNKFHGAYGPRLRLHPVHEEDISVAWRMAGVLKSGYGPPVADQFRAVVIKLTNDRDTRQALMSIWDPTLDNLVDTKDTPCNVMLMFNIRNNLLNMTLIRRSSDAVWGMSYDHLIFSVMLDTIAATLGIESGEITEVSNSLHFYTELYKDQLEASFGAPVLYDVGMGPRLSIDRLDPLLDEFRALERMMRLHVKVKEIEKFVIDTRLVDGWWSQAFLLMFTYIAFIKEDAHAFNDLAAELTSPQFVAATFTTFEKKTTNNAYLQSKLTEVQKDLRRRTLGIW